jgi:uracil-xanthine permease
MFKWEKVSNSEQVVAAHQRLDWGKTIGIGAQHVVAMFGATFLVPLLTGFSPATTLFFSSLATALFLLINRNRVPSYLGSSFAFIAPILAAVASTGNMGVATFGVLCTGVLLLAVGVIVHFAGAKWIDTIMPPVVTGAIVALIGFNLAPAAWQNFDKAPVTALVTLLSTLLIAAIFKGIIGRLSILLGVAVGYVYALFVGEVDYSALKDAPWVGLPHFIAPEVDFSVLAMFLPVVLVLIAENIGHVKSVAQMTGENLDGFAGRALMADGIGTILAGFGGGSGTTTYAENIGVMASTKVYSTAAYWVASATALLLSLCPKFGAAVATVPAGVLGGATTLLYGMIGMLGVRIWVENKVDFSKQANVFVAAIAMIIGIADFTFSVSGVSFNGIAIGSLVCVVVYHLFRFAPAFKHEGTHDDDVFEIDAKAKVFDAQGEVDDNQG